MRLNILVWLKIKNFWIVFSLIGNTKLTYITVCKLSLYVQFPEEILLQLLKLNKSNKLTDYHNAYVRLDSIRIPTSVIIIVIFFSLYSIMQ